MHCISVHQSVTSHSPIGHTTLTAFLCFLKKSGLLDLLAIEKLCEMLDVDSLSVNDW